MQVYATTSSYSEEDTNRSYNNVDQTLGKPIHYTTIVMRDLNAQIGKGASPTEMATGNLGLECRNERGDTVIKWATSRKYKIKNTMLQKKAGRRWTWKRPKFTRLVMSNIKLDLDVERKTSEYDCGTCLAIHCFKKLTWDAINVVILGQLLLKRFSAHLNKIISVLLLSLQATYA